MTNQRGSDIQVTGPYLLLVELGALIRKFSGMSNLIQKQIANGSIFLARMAPSPAPNKKPTPYYPMRHLRPSCSALINLATRLTNYEEQFHGCTASDNVAGNCAECTASRHMLPDHCKKGKSLERKLRRRPSQTCCGPFSVYGGCPESQA